MFSTPASSTGLGRRLCAWATFIVVALVLVPPFVRATQSFNADSGPSLRLNRGFDAPELKCRVAPPDAVPCQVPASEPTQTSTSDIARPAAEVLPSALLDASPQVLRGPPAPLPLA